MILAVLVVLGVAGYFGWREWHGSDSTAQVRAPRPCVTPSVPPTPAAPGQVAVAVLNTTDRVGLAHTVARELHLRGFRVGHVGNTTPRQSGTASVTYGPGTQAAALAVAEQVPGATVVAAGSPGLTLQLGAGFRTLATPAQVGAARAHDLAAASPRPAVCPSS